MNNIESLTEVYTRAKSMGDIPLMWKILKDFEPVLMNHFSLNEAKHIYDEKYLDIPLDPTTTANCLICENNVYYVE
jgi:hypothetical protein